MPDLSGPTSLRVLDFVPSGCCVVGREGGILFWNQTLELWTGMRSPEVLGRSLFELYPALAEPRYRDRILAVLQQGIPTVFSSSLNPSFFPCQKSGGRPRIQETTLVRLDDDAGGEGRVLIVITDVTEQVERGEKYRQARLQAVRDARELRESEERRRIIADLSLATILIGDAEGVIHEANSAAGPMFGREPSSVTGLPLASLVPEEGNLVPITGEGEEASGDGREVECLRADGSRFPARLIVRPLQLGDTPGFVAHIWDISERKRTEEVLRQSQKQESLAILAAGIAHDFNNHFGGILGNLDLIGNRLSEGSPLVPYLDRVRQEILRATGLSRKMLALAGSPNLAVGQVELNQVVEELRPGILALLPEGGELCLICDPEPIPVEGDAFQLRQIILGVATNAVEALAPGGGRVELRTGRVFLDRECLNRDFPGQPMVFGDFGFLEVRDSGSGIPPELMSRIFDPFFSTKFCGRGLSLAFVRSILQAHGGGWSIQSQVDLGTVFTLYLPVQPDSGGPASEGVEPVSAATGGLILVVDDEAVLRESTAELLHELGYRVEMVENGREAVDFYRSHPGGVSLVLMDMTMPVMGGRDAFLALREMDPEAKVILMSGYSELDVTQAFRSGELSAFLPKPFRLTELAQVVEAAVGLP
nr:PAS domain S-box protein [uncultured Holophaga sp.]